MSTTTEATARITHLLGHTPWEGEAARTSEVFNPATGEVTGRLDLADADVVDQVVSHAAAAAAEWADVSLARRTRILFAFRQLLEERTDEIAKVITAEHGKTYDDAKAEIARGREVVDFACGIE